MQIDPFPTKGLSLSPNLDLVAPIRTIIIEQTIPIPPLTHMS